MTDLDEVVADTNVLINLAKPVVDNSGAATTGPDPLKRFLTGYDVWVPDGVMGELTTLQTARDGIVEAAATTVLRAAGHLTVEDDYPDPARSTASVLDDGERAAISLTNDRRPAMFVTDAFGKKNLPIIIVGLDDPGAWSSTPELLCQFAGSGRCQAPHVRALLSYYEQTCGWESAYIEQLRLSYSV